MCQRPQLSNERQRIVNIRKPRRAIFLQVHVRKSSIVQVHGQTHFGESVAWKQGTNRFEEDLVFRVKERILVKGFYEFGALLGRACMVAERTEDLNLCLQHCNAVHGEFTVQGDYHSVRIQFLKSN
jgi:hypothetical protein